MTCVRPDVVTSMPEVRLPGGPVLSAIPSGSVPSESEVTRALLGQLQAAMAPLMPLFRLLDTVLALKDLAQAIPDALGPPPNPGKLAGAVSRVVSTADALAQLVPQLSVPILVRDLVTLLVRYLDTIETDLVGIEATLAGAAAAAVQATELDEAAPGAASGLRETETCTTQQAQDRLAGVVAAAGPVVGILGIVALLAGLAGLPEPPSLSLGGDDVQAVRGAVAATRSALETFLQVIP